MQVEDLKIWVDLIDTKSFSKCAEINFISQPAVSQKVKLLEDLYKTPLFLRTKNSLSPTQAGKILYEESKKIIELYRALVPKVRSFSGEIHGEIKIAATYSIGLYYLRGALVSFAEAYPLVKLDVKLYPSSEIYNGILTDAIDIGFVCCPQECPCAENIRFLDDNLILVTHPSHPLARFKSIDMGKICKYDFIGFDDDNPIGCSISKAFRDFNLTLKPKRHYENIELIKNAIEQNAGISILPYLSVKKELKLKILSGINFNCIRLKLPIAIAHKRGKTLFPAEQKFIEECLTAAQK